MYILNIICAFIWDKKKKLTARMLGVERFKILTHYFYFLWIKGSI